MTDEEFESKVRKVMEELQRGRVCTPYTCAFCREKAEAIVTKLSD